MTSAVRPTTAVLLEALRAAGSLAAAPFFAAGYLARRARLAAEVERELGRPAAPAPLPEPPPALAHRPLRLFVSCAEPSGETHAVHLVAALRAELERAGAPAPELVGLGGERLAAAGVRLVGDPLRHAAMGTDVLRHLPFYVQLLRAAAAELARPTDLLLAVDSPALHVPLGHLAHRSRVPVAHLATPQYWAWAPWRVRSYRRAVDLALSILPFEPAWLERRGVRVAHVGHPHLDALADVPRAAAPAEAGAPLALLPGSRASVVRRNLPWMITTVARLRAAHPGLEALVPAARPELVAPIERALAEAGASAWARVEPDLHATLRRARAALSVSGTVLIDLLHHRLPAVVVYRLERALAARLAPRVLSVPWFASVNLLAGREVLPEFVFAGEGPREAVSEALARCYNDQATRRAARAGLEEAARRLGPPGAIVRAARHALALAAAPRPPSAP